MTPEMTALLTKYLPWLVPILPILPFIPKAIKRYQAAVKKIADDALAEEAAERTACDERVRLAREDFKVEMEGKYSALETKVNRLESEQKSDREKMAQTRNGIYRVLLAVAAAKVDPTKLDGIMDDLTKIAEEL